MNVPSQQDIQSRLAYVSCVDKLDGMYFSRKKIRRFKDVFVYFDIWPLQLFVDPFCLLIGVKAAGKAGHCEYIRPPIDKYSTMQFGSFDEIREVRKYIKLDILRYIDPSRHNFEKCLLPCFVPQSCLSSQINMERDNFQNYGGKDQCIYL